MPASAASVSGGKDSGAAHLLATAGVRRRAAPQAIPNQKYTLATNTKRPKPREVEVVYFSCQLSKAELEEDIRANATLEIGVREPTIPNATIKLVGQEDQKWEVQLRNPKHFDGLVGRDVLNAFCRCFVHAARLTSTISCMYASERYHGRDSVAFERDLDTQVWFTVGTLRELAIAIRELRSALRKRDLLDHESDPWVTLRKLEKRWEDDEFYRKMRNVAAFHVDKGCVNEGLDKLLMEQCVPLAIGQGSMQGHNRLTLGFLALQNGLGVDLDGYRKFLDVTVGDLAAAGPAIQDAFILAAKAVGVPFEYG